MTEVNLDEGKLQEVAWTEDPNNRKNFGAWTKYAT